MKRRENYLSTSWSDKFIVPILHEELNTQLKSCFTKWGTTGMKVLDAGCGEQPLRSAILNAGHSYFSLDIQQNSKSNVDFFGRLDGKLNLPDIHKSSFHLIICTEVLEHVLDWNAAFENFENLLAPGGLLLITCPFHFYLHEIPYDYWRPTHYAITGFADRYHFSVLSNKPLGNVGDILGTYTAVTSFKPSGNSLKSYIIYYWLKILHKCIYKSAEWGWYKKIAYINPRLYLSNCFLLQYRKH